MFFDALGETLERLIDDGSWRRIRVLPVRSQVCPALTSTQPPAHPAGGSAFPLSGDTSISARFEVADPIVLSEGGSQSTPRRPGQGPRAYTWQGIDEQRPDGGGEQTLGSSRLQSGSFVPAALVELVHSVVRLAPTSSPRRALEAVTVYETFWYLPLPAVGILLRACALSRPCRHL